MVARPDGTKYSSEKSQRRWKTAIFCSICSKFFQKLRFWKPKKLQVMFEQLVQEQLLAHPLAEKTLLVIEDLRKKTEDESFRDALGTANVANKRETRNINFTFRNLVQQPT